MTIREALQLGERQLAAVPDPKLDAAALLCHVTGLERLPLMLRAQESMTPEQEQRFRSLLLLRAQRKPLQYLLGVQWFYGLPFAVDERVLIPRQETETLCELALERLRLLPAPAVLDVCTGSGAIAVTLAHECPAARLTATDLSADALAVARSNAERNGAAVDFRLGDLLAPVAGQRFDMIVSNPPYIESGVCPTLQAEVLREPLMALDGGPDGLAFYRRLAQGAPGCLAEDGWLLMEIGDTQGAAVSALLEAEGFADVAVHKDLYGLDRVVCGRRLGSAPRSPLP